METKYPLFKKARTRKLLIATLLELFFLLILQPTINFLIMNNQTMSFTDLFTAEITISFVVLFVIYASWKIWKWKKEDSKAEREDEKILKNDFIEIIDQLHNNQVLLSCGVRDDNNIQVHKCMDTIKGLREKLKDHKSGERLYDLKFEDDKKLRVRNEPH